MSTILIHHHPGLGDHIMCHGIVREYAKKYGRVGLLALPRNFASVNFMYRDISNLAVISATEAEAKEFVAENARAGGLGFEEIKVIGFEHLDRTSGVPLQKQLYRIAEVTLSKTWDNFFVARDIARERALYEKVAPNGDYIFLHEDAPRNYRIERKLIDKKFKIVEPNEKLTDNIFDYCSVIEKAKEIHVIDSSFMFLIDCLAYNAPGQKLYVHRYARENEMWKLPVLKKNWKILTLGSGATQSTGLFSKFLDKFEVLLLTHKFSKRITRKIYRIFGWRTRSQKRGITV